MGDKLRSKSWVFYFFQFRFSSYLPLKISLWHSPFFPTPPPPPTILRISNEFPWGDCGQNSRRRGKLVLISLNHRTAAKICTYSVHQQPLDQTLWSLEPVLEHFNTFISNCSVVGFPHGKFCCCFHQSISRLSCPWRSLYSMLLWWPYRRWVWYHCKQFIFLSRCEYS